MSEKSRKICALASVCFLYTLPFAAISVNTSSSKKGEIMEVYAVNDTIIDEDVFLSKTIETPQTQTQTRTRSVNEDIITEKVADFSQRYSEVNKFFYVNKNAEIKLSDDDTSEIIATANYGEYINCIGEDLYDNDGYYKVLFNNVEGFIKVEDVTTETLFKEENKVVYIKSNTEIMSDFKDAQALGNLEQYNSINVIAVNNELNLYKVQKDNIIGYIAKDITSDEMLFDNTQKAMYTNDNVNILPAPADSAAIKSYSVFSEVSVVGLSEDWAKIELSSGEYGFIKTNLLTNECPKAVRAVSYAYGMIGTPYVYGAASRRATDCSGFTMQCYAAVGIYLPHSAAAQNGCGTHVSLSEAKPGDLLIWSGGNNGSISHVGIYVGNDTMVHASSSRGVIATSVLNYRSHSQLVSVVRVTNN